MDIKELKTTIIKNQHNKKIQNCIGSVGKTVEELFDGIDESFPVELPVKPEICVHIFKIDSGGSFIDSERLSKRFTEYNLIPQLETKINLISEDGQYLEQFEVIQIYYEVDKKLKIDIFLDEY